MDQTVIGMCSAGVVLFAVSALAARNAVAGAAGTGKIVALGNLCIAVPLAVFGALHLFGPGLVFDIVPEYMPWRMFWVYFVGAALVASSVSIATGVLLRWSGLLFGLMMLLFVAMIHLPGALGDPHDRFIWTIVLREMSFGGAGVILAGTAESGWPAKMKSALRGTGRVLITMTVLFFAVEHFLHPTGLPGVPLRKETPVWVPWREVIDYLTGAALLVTGASVFRRGLTRTVAAWTGGWLLLLILVIYVPVMVDALADTEAGAAVQGINYFADTLLFAGVILTLAKAPSKGVTNVHAERAKGSTVGELGGLG